MLCMQMEEAKQNICSVAGQTCFCCLLGLIELKLMWNSRISENMSKAKWKNIILFWYINECGDIAETFGQLLIVFSRKVDLLYLFYSAAWRCCLPLLHLIKESCWLENFLGIIILMTKISPYLFSLLELIWNSITFL